MLLVTLCNTLQYEYDIRHTVLMDTVRNNEKVVVVRCITNIIEEVNDA